MNFWQNLWKWYTIFLIVAVRDTRKTQRRIQKFGIGEGSVEVASGRAIFKILCQK